LGHYKCITVAVSALFAVTLYISYLNYTHRQELEKLENRLIAECNQAQRTTRETNDELQKNRDDIARKLADLKRVRGEKCLLVAGKTDIITGGKSGYDGEVRYGDLLEYGAECERYRRELITVGKFLDAALER